MELSDITFVISVKHLAFLTIQPLRTCHLYQTDSTIMKLRTIFVRAYYDRRVLIKLLGGELTPIV